MSENQSGRYTTIRLVVPCRLTHALLSAGQARRSTRTRFTIPARQTVTWQITSYALTTLMMMSSSCLLKSTSSSRPKQSRMTWLREVSLKGFMSLPSSTSSTISSLQTPSTVRISSSTPFTASSQVPLRICGHAAQNQCGDETDEFVLVKSCRKQVCRSPSVKTSLGFKVCASICSAKPCVSVSFVWVRNSCAIHANSALSFGMQNSIDVLNCIRSQAEDFQRSFDFVVHPPWRFKLGTFSSCVVVPRRIASDGGGGQQVRWKIVVLCVASQEIEGFPEAHWKLFTTLAGRGRRHSSVCDRSVGLSLVTAFQMSREMMEVRIWLSFLARKVRAEVTQSRRDFTRQSENSKRVHLSVPTLQTSPKFHEKTPQREKKEWNFWREREQKARNCGSPTLRVPSLRAPNPSWPPPFVAPTFRCPYPSGPNFFWVWAPPFGAMTYTQIQMDWPKLDWPKLDWPQLDWPKLALAKIGGAKTTMAKNGLAKIGLAKIGQIRMAKCGLAKFGQIKLAKFGQIRLAKCGQLSLAKCGPGQMRFGHMRSRPPPPAMPGLWGAHHPLRSLDLRGPANAL